MYHEYKDSNQFTAYSGYVFAAATGALRMMNNRHYISDVLAGAGIGILTVNLVYRFEPLKNWHPFGIGAEKDILIFPNIGSDSCGISLVIEFKEGWGKAFLLHPHNFIDLRFNPFA